MGEEKVRNDKKRKEFAENPDNFVKLEDCLIIVKYDAEKHMEIMVNLTGTREAMLVRQTVDIELLSIILAMKRSAAAKKKATSIIVPQSNIKL